MTNIGLYNECSDFGWPLAYLCLSETGEIGAAPSFEPHFDYEWNIGRMLMNGLFGALLTVAVAFAAERWVRSERRLQFSILGLLSATAATGILIALGHEMELPYRDFDPEFNPFYWSLVSIEDLRHPFRWPSLIALAIAIYLAAWLLLRAIAWQMTVRWRR
jgi:hypothetical protein